MATTGGISSSDIRDLMIESIERRFSLVNRLPAPIEWLSDNGSPYTANETRAFAVRSALFRGRRRSRARSRTVWPKPL